MDSQALTILAFAAVGGAIIYALMPSRKPAQQIIIREPAGAPESVLHTAFTSAKTAGEVAGLQKILAAHGEQTVRRTFADAFGDGAGQPAPNR